MLTVPQVGLIRLVRTTRRNTLTQVSSNMIYDSNNLIQNLTTHFKAPQASERWSMYRLVTPLIDYACFKAGLESYFEFPQTSSHGNSQSVDIALLDNGKPSVLVEAKRVSRSISLGQIEKYLEVGVAGIVSNGSDWILCREGAASHVRLWNPGSEAVSHDSIRDIVDFIAGSDSIGQKIQPNVDIKPILRPKKPAKGEKAHRQVNEVLQIKSGAELQGFIKQNERLTVSDRAFLTAFAEIVAQPPEHIEIEVRASRLSVWVRSSGRRQRKMRIEFGKREPSILILKSIVDGNDTLRHSYAHYRHDKHGGMREIRPPDARQSADLGRILGLLLGK